MEQEGVSCVTRHSRQGERAVVLVLIDCDDGYGARRNRGHGGSITHDTHDKLVFKSRVRPRYEMLIGREPSMIWFDRRDICLVFLQIAMG